MIEGSTSNCWFCFTMRVKVFGILKTFVGGRELIEISLHSEKRVNDIIGCLNIPDNYVFLVEKSGKPVPKDLVLSNDDEIALVPLLSGG